MKIKYVAQKHEYGCSVACMAMITGLSYDEIERAFARDFSRGGLESNFSRAFICDHDFSAMVVTPHGYSDIRASNRRVSRPFADVHFVSVRPFPDSTLNHAVVMDRRGRVFDPQTRGHRDLSPFYYINYVVGFFDERRRSKRR
jgi:hypothetical protein